MLIGNPQERKAEVEILQELIPIAKARYGAGRGNARDSGPARGAGDTKFTVDTPVPYRISDLIADHRRAHGQAREQARPVALPQPASTASRPSALDPRYAFMFGSLTVYDGMAQILGRIFRVPVNDKPITILELTGLPTEIINVVVSVLCRMTFDFALWSEGQVPVTLVCEEAHRYVPANADARLRALQARHRQDRQGRPQVRRLAVHRHAAPGRDRSDHPVPVQHRVRAAHVERPRPGDREVGHRRHRLGPARVPAALGQREAIAFGDGVTLPVRIKFDELPKHCMPRSSTARFTEKWQKSVGDEGFLEAIVDRWRALAIPAGTDSMHNLSMMADAIGLRETGPLDEALRDALAQRPNLTPPAPTSDVNADGRLQAPPFRRDASPSGIKRRATPNRLVDGNAIGRAGSGAHARAPAATNPGCRDKFVAIAPRAVNASVLKTPTAPGAIFALNM